MKFEIQRDFETTDSKPFFAFRMYPETNEEMGIMEWGVECMPNPEPMRRIFNGKGDKTFHYAIIFNK